MRRDEKQLEAKDIDKESLDGFAHHAENTVADQEPYGPPGLRGLVANPFVFPCAARSTLGGLVFGYDQGVVSVILVMDQFQEQFPQVAPGAPGGGFWKGLMTAMIELGALTKFGNSIPGPGQLETTMSIDWSSFANYTVEYTIKCRSQLMQYSVTTHKRVETVHTPQAVIQLSSILNLRGKQMVEVR